MSSAAVESAVCHTVEAGWTKTNGTKILVVILSKEEGRNSRIHKVTMKEERSDSFLVCYKRKRC